MRIAIVGNFGLTYKATMAARALPLARELAERGHRVALFLPEDPWPADPASIGSAVRLASLGPSLVGRRESKLLLAIRHLILGLRLTVVAFRYRPDVLYAFKPKAYAGLALLIFWLLREVGLSRTRLALDTDDWEGTGGWAEREHGLALTRALVSWHERWCLGHADVVTVASRGLAELVDKHRASSVYLPNAAAPTSPGWRPGRRQPLHSRLGLGDVPIVLAYTRFAEFAPERLLAVFQAIAAEVPDARLIVAGKGLRGEEAAFKQLADRAGLAAAIHVLGWKSIDELPDVFAAADVALYPLDDTLLNRTKCPMKLVDLLLAGVPVVADRVGQAAEYVDDGRTGVLVPARDVSAMARAAATILQSPSNGRELGAAARTAMLTSWTWKQQADLVARELRLGGERHR
ncbi:MAG TPA: glycosyltransferase family 4 protein [Chloroflexota bacterium]|nr:glycosyltransferase family 4 protein [Chloroflexota bacterium]